jgi:hypothetical protein
MWLPFEIKGKFPDIYELTTTTKRVFLSLTEDAEFPEF